MDFVFSGYDIIGFGTQSFAVPVDSEKEWVKRLAAANASYPHYSSVDYIIKRFSKEFCYPKRQSRVESLLREVITISERITSNVLAKRSRLHDLPDHFGMLTSGAALMRLDATFSIARLMVLKGFIFESASLLRLILEQLSWAYQVRRFPDEEVKEYSPRKSISDLKTLLPEAGKLYGQLSERAHIERKQLRRLVDLSDDQIKVVFSNKHDILYEASMLLDLSDWYGVVMEMNYADYYESFEFIKIEENRWIANHDRKSLAAINEVIRKLGEYRVEQKSKQGEAAKA